MSMEFHSVTLKTIGSEQRWRLRKPRLSRRRYSRKKPSSEAPSHEVVYKIPELSDRMKTVIEDVKKQFFEMRLCNISMLDEIKLVSVTPRSDLRKDKPTSHSITGYDAFRQYYWDEIWGISSSRSSQLISAAWRMNSYKAVWCAYAEQYNRYVRETSFREWLSKCEQSKNPDDLIVFIEEPGLFY